MKRGLFGTACRNTTSAKVARWESEGVGETKTNSRRSGSPSPSTAGALLFIVGDGREQPSQVVRHVEPRVSGVTGAPLGGIRVNLDHPPELCFDVLSQDRWITGQVPCAEVLVGKLEEPERNR